MAKPVQIPLTRIRRQGADVFARVCYRGEEVVVTTYGKPIARIVPIEVASAPLPRRPARINPTHIGDFDEFLREEGIYDEVSQVARDRVARWLLAQRGTEPVSKRARKMRRKG